MTRCLNSHKRFQPSPWPGLDSNLQGPWPGKALGAPSTSHLTSHKNARLKAQTGCVCWNRTACFLDSLIPEVYRSAQRLHPLSGSPGRSRLLGHPALSKKSPGVSMVRDVIKHWHLGYYGKWEVFLCYSIFFNLLISLHISLYMSMPLSEAHM